MVWIYHWWFWLDIMVKLHMLKPKLSQKGKNDFCFQSSTFFGLRLQNLITLMLVFSISEWLLNDAECLYVAISLINIIPLSLSDLLNIVSIIQKSRLIIVQLFFILTFWAIYMDFILHWALCEPISHKE